MKTILNDYTFSSSVGTITFTNREFIDRENLLLITNLATGEVIYQFNDPAKGGTVVGNVLTLDHDTTAMNDADVLQIHYNAQYGEMVNDKVVVGNARSKFRDGFANQEVTQPDPAVWDLANDQVYDQTTNPTGHIVNTGGDAVGSSYLRVSLSPFLQASQVLLTSKKAFKFPFRFGYGLSLSQRVLGQEVFVGMVGTDASGIVEQDATLIADKPITGATASITTNVATFTINNHGMKGGDRVVIFGCLERRLNVGPQLVTVIDANTFTVPVTLTNGTYSTTGGVVQYLDVLRNARNGAGLMHENATVTNASFVTKRNSTRPRILNATVSTTVAVQSNTSPYSDAFNPAGVYELFMNLEEVGFRSFLNDALATPTGIGKWTTGVPDEEKDYKIQLRARNLPNLTKPVARILTIAKTGTTTATVTTDVPHGLTPSDWVQITGVRDRTNFPNLAITGISSVPSSTTFTIIIGTATTTSSVDGVVFRNEGSVVHTAYTPSINTVTRTNNILTLLGDGTWGTPLPGEWVHIWGVTPALSGIEGAYKVLRTSTSTLELDAPGEDVASTPTGGSVIKRTDVRLHYSRLMDYTRHYTEIVGGRGNTTDINNAVPVAITGGATVSVSGALTQGTGIGTSQWSAAGWGGFLVIDVASAAIITTTTTAAVTPGSLNNVGTYAHSFNVAVTVVTGTTPTLDIGVEESTDNGINWVRIYDFERITATGFYTSPLIRAQYGTRYRYVQTVAGATPSFTRAINRVQFSSNAPLHRRLIDRSIVLTTLNSVTPTYNVDGVDTVQLLLNIGAITTTAPQIQLEGSEDGANWYAIGTPLTAVASSTVAALSTPVMCKFIRGRVSTAGVGVTAGYVAIKGTGQ